VAKSKSLLRKIYGHHPDFVLYLMYVLRLTDSDYPFVIFKLFLLTYSLIVLLYFVLFVRTDDKTGLFELEYSIKRNQIQQQERAFSGYQFSYLRVANLSL
jgi:hypothetical protein